MKKVPHLFKKKCDGKLKINFQGPYHWLRRMLSGRRHEILNLLPSLIVKGKFIIYDLYNCNCYAVFAHHALTTYHCRGYVKFSDL